MTLSHSLFFFLILEKCPNWQRRQNLRYFHIDIKKIHSNSPSCKNKTVEFLCISETATKKTHKLRHFKENRENLLQQQLYQLIE